MKHLSWILKPLSLNWQPPKRLLGFLLVVLSWVPAGLFGQAWDSIPLKVEECFQIHQPMSNWGYMMPGGLTPATVPFKEFIQLDNISLSPDKKSYTFSARYIDLFHLDTVSTRHYVVYGYNVDNEWYTGPLVLYEEADFADPRIIHRTRNDTIYVLRYLYEPEKAKRRTHVKAEKIVGDYEQYFSDSVPGMGVYRWSTYLWGEPQPPKPFYAKLDLPLHPIDEPFTYTGNLLQQETFGMGDCYFSPSSALIRASDFDLGLVYLRASNGYYDYDAYSQRWELEVQHFSITDSTYTFSIGVRNCGTDTLTLQEAKPNQEGVKLIMARPIVPNRQVHWFTVTFDKKRYALKNEYYEGAIEMDFGLGKTHLFQYRMRFSQKKEVQLEIVPNLNR